jgi:flavin reductase (DIM6/NTAB) family NADH-FMN oxidoreductase RutF
LDLCGSKSGRDIDKAAVTGLTPFETSQGIVSFTQARLIIECQKIYYQDINPQNFLDPTIDQAYPHQDYHRMYLGEVKRCLSSD